MSDQNAELKFKFTESSLEKISSLGEDPRNYLSSPVGITLRNMGEEIKILGKTKFVAFGEDLSPVRTGIKVVIPEGYYGTFLETQDILHTSLAVRPVIFNHDFVNELTVNFFNIGEREVVIPRFAVLPVVFVAKPFCKNSKIISDLEYLESAPAQVGVDSET